MRKCRYWLFMILMIYMSVEASSFGCLYLLAKVRNIDYAPRDGLSNEHRIILSDFIKGANNYLSYSPTLGWTIKANGHSSRYHANSQGMRSSKDYPAKPSQNILRVASFGDSFTHGDDVEDNETWQAQLEGIRADSEVLNFGVGGFGLDQAYIRYLVDGMKFEPQMILIGFMSENIFRNVNQYRPFYFSKTGIPLAKPRFVLKDSQLYLMPNPISSLQDYSLLLSQPREMLLKLGANDYYYANLYESSVFDLSPTFRLIKVILNKFRNKDNILVEGYYNQTSDAFQITKKICDAFYFAAITDNALPIILLFPSKTDLKRWKKQGTTVYGPLLSYFHGKGYLYIDLLFAFDQDRQDYDIDDLFTSGGHYSPLGNQIVAKYIDSYLNMAGYRGREEVLDKLVHLRCELTSCLSRRGSSD